MPISKSYTTDTYDIERQKRIEESLKIIKKGKKKTVVRLIEREKMIERVQDMYYKNIKKRELCEFFEEVADFMLKK